MIAVFGGCFLHEIIDILVEDKSVCLKIETKREMFSQFKNSKEKQNKLKKKDKTEYIYRNNIYKRLKNKKKNHYIKIRRG